MEKKGDSLYVNKSGKVQRIIYTHLTHISTDGWLHSKEEYPMQPI